MIISLTIGDDVLVEAPNSLRPWRGRFVRWLGERTSAVMGTPGPAQYCLVQPMEGRHFSPEPVELPARYVRRPEDT